MTSYFPQIRVTVFEMFHFVLPPPPLPSKEKGARFLAFLTSVVLFVFRDTKYVMVTLLLLRTTYKIDLSSVTSGCGHVAVTGEVRYTWGNISELRIPRWGEYIFTSLPIGVGTVLPCFKLSVRGSLYSNFFPTEILAELRLHTWPILFYPLNSNSLPTHAPFSCPLMLSNQRIFGFF